LRASTKRKEGNSDGKGDPDVQGSVEAVSNGGFDHPLSTKESPLWAKGVVEPPLGVHGIPSFFFHFLNKKFNYLVTCQYLIGLCVSLLSQLTVNLRKG
jgi:hypothetical protein